MIRGYYHDTRSAVTRWSFNNDQRHVTAIRPVSEAAHIWSYDKLYWNALGCRRFREVMHGIPVFTEDGERVGLSKRAAVKAIAQVVVSRVSMATPGMCKWCCIFIFSIFRWILASCQWSSDGSCLPTQANRTQRISAVIVGPCDPWAVMGNCRFWN